MSAGSVWRESQPEGESKGIVFNGQGICFVEFASLR
jgi:hypothetical protein